MSSSSIRFIKILLKKLTCSIATPSLVLARYKMKEVTNSEEKKVEKAVKISLQNFYLYYSSFKNELSCLETL